LLGSATLIGGTPLKLLFCLAVLPTFATYCWLRLIDPQERAFLRARLAPRWRTGEDSTPA
jgi:hypothetical protein